jgi:hypothetical protein
MRLRYFLLFCALVAWFGCDGVRGQTTQIAPDCVIPFSYTTTGRTPSTGYANFSTRGQIGCVVWVVTYQNQGFTPIFLEIDSAADTVVGGSHVPGTWGAFSGAIIDGNAAGAATGPGVNPNTDTNWGFTMLKGSPAWVSVNLSTATGAGLVSGTLLGWRPHGVGDTTSASGGGGPTVGPVNAIQASDGSGGHLNSGCLGVAGAVTCAPGSLLISNNSAATRIVNDGIDLVEDGVPAHFGVTDYGVNGVTNSPGLLGVAARGSLASPAAVQNGDVLLSVGARAYRGGGFTTTISGGYRIVASETWTIAHNGAYNAFRTTANGSTTSFERMRIHPSGGVSINNTTDPGTGNLSVTGKIGATDTISPGTIVFGSLPASVNSAQLYCSDCTVTSSIDNTCAGSGSGAVALRINGAWKCQI